MSDLLNFFCFSRLKDFMSPRCSQTTAKPKILVPPPPNISDQSSDQNATSTKSSSIKRLLEKTSYIKKKTPDIFDKIKTVQNLNVRTEDTKITKKKYLRNWSKEEDATLKKLFQNFGGKWDLISKKMDKTANQCSHRWRKIKPKEMIIRRLWTKEEDEKLLKLVEIHGKKFSVIANFMKERNRKQVRDRYNNILDPKIQKNYWTPVEDKKLIDLFKNYGAKWALISSHFDGKSETMIKNRYNNHLKKKVCESVIETENHECSEIEIKEKSFFLQNPETPLTNQIPNNDVIKYLEGLNSILNPNCLLTIVESEKLPKISMIHGMKMDIEKNPFTFYPHEIKVSSGSDSFKSPHLYESEKSILNSLKNINIHDEEIS